MKRFLTLLAISLFAAAYSRAITTVAVLEIVPKSEIDVSITEMRHLTDELRRQAVLALPNDDYAILTRDNMLALMPPDEEEAECLAEGCAVDIGRAIGAEYISQGSIGSFGGELSVSVELYETMSGKLLGSIVMESHDVKGLMVAIREQSPSLFSRIAKGTVPSVADSKTEQSRTIPTNIPTGTNNTSTWVAISLDVLGAVALGFGIYKHIDANKLYDDYKKMPEGAYKKEVYEAAFKKVDDARTLRSIGLIAGGVLLASGIAVHIWF
jgi:hypothetical protein